MPLFFSKKFKAGKKRTAIKTNFFNPITTMRLLQTITIHDEASASGFVTLQKDTEAYFWLQAICEQYHRIACCAKTTDEGVTIYTFVCGDINDLHIGIDKYFRTRSLTKFPPEEFMQKYTNVTARSNDDRYLSDEISSTLLFLSPIKSLIKYSDLKCLTIKFTEKEEQE